MLMQPWVRLNYASDYFLTTFQYYINTYPAYIVDYYSFDETNSIYDAQYLQGGSYEKLGIGELSGVKFKKILSLPVFETQQVQPMMDSGENGGFQASDSMMSSFMIPQIYDLKPNVGDFIDLNNGLFNDKNFNRAIYVVTNYNLAHHGDHLNIYQLSIQVAPLEKQEVEKQISSYWQFYEPSKEILRLKNSTLLNKMTLRGNDNINNLKSLFDKKVNFYLEQDLI